MQIIDVTLNGYVTVVTYFTGNEFPTLTKKNIKRNCIRILNHLELLINADKSNVCSMYVCMYICVCACVREREKKIKLYM